jgi:hypothetical protein
VGADPGDVVPAEGSLDRLEVWQLPGRAFKTARCGCVHVFVARGLVRPGRLHLQRSAGARHHAERGVDQRSLPDAELVAGRCRCPVDVPTS